MNLFWKVTRYARAARFWLLLALAALAWLGLGGDAKAQAVGCQGHAAQCSVTQAMSACTTWAGSIPANQRVIQECNRVGDSVIMAQACSWWASGGECYIGTYYTMYFDFVSDCPSGTVWNNTTKRCDCPPGTTFRPDGTCKSCESMNSEPGFGNQTVARPFKERCLGGCTFRAKPNASTCMLIGGAGAGTQHCSGEWEFTGASCSVGSGDPPMLESPVPGEPGTQKPKQECTPAGAGQTVCIKENGDHCYSASTGRQICWKPGQAGEQGDGPVAQVRKPGTETPLPTSMQTNAGDALTAEGEPMTVTTVVNGQLTVTTTTQNYRTEHGTDAKPDNSGQPSDGSDEEQQDGSASGGTDCDTRPIVSDPALEMVATQAWATRCAVEAGNAASVSGDVGDCKSPFTVEGDNANAHKLRAMRAQICGPEARADAARAEAEGVSDALAGDIAGMEAEIQGESVFAEPGEAQQLSSTRFGGGGSCPQFNIATPIGTFNAPPMFCSILAALRILFITVATVWGLYRIREA